MANQNLSIKERFESKYIPEPNSGCWLWVASTDRTGYGMMAVGQKRVYAHRVSWLLYRDGSADGLFVCHKCDTPACVNPDHLFLGTVTDNNHDAIRKGRARKALGVAHGRAKLTEGQVIAIRRSPESHRTLATIYGIGKTAVEHIKKGWTWGSVA